MSWFLALNYKQMKKIVRIITIVVFIVAVFPISTCMRKSTEKNIEQFKEARKVTTEAEFAEALKFDGWVYAKGAFVGKAPLEKLNEGSKTLNIDALFTNKKEAERVAEKLKGDFIRVWLELGTVDRENPGDAFSINPTYTALAETDYLTFLGQDFSPEYIIPLLNKKEKIQYPERGSSAYAYELEMIRSPYETWLKVLAADGKIVEKEISVVAGEHINDLLNASEGKSKNAYNYPIYGFLGFWLVLLLILLWLEGKWIKR